MSRLFENVISGATAGGLIGAAFDGLVIAGATLLAGPVGFATATTAVASKAAAGTLIGGAAGVAKTIKEETEGGEKNERRYYHRAYRRRSKYFDSPDFKGVISNGTIERR